MAWISPNRLLSMTEMENNAPLMHVVFVNASWHPLSIAAMLGNVQVESTINPGVWSGRPQQTGSVGLVQWNPSTKLTNWAADEGLDYTDGNVQCQRILYELANGLQWQATSGHNLTFQQFAYNELNKDLDYLTDAWCYCYERPGQPDIVTRRANAAYWLNYFKSFPVWLLYKFLERLRY